MPRVVVTGPVPDGGLDPLDGHDVVVLGSEDRPSGVGGAAEIGGAEGLVCFLTDTIDAAVFDAAPALRVVANVAVGYDNVDVDEARRRGIIVCNTPGVLDETTADLTWTLILAASRNLSSAEADVRSGRWDGWRFTDHLGQDVHGKTLGIVGMGRIGRAVARRATGFSMRIIHHSRTPDGSDGFRAALGELLAESDVVSLHVPLSPETHHLVGARELDAMKPTAVLVNTSRGPVVDEGALAEALEQRTIFAAGLDVYEHEPAVHPGLLTSPHVTLAPHLGSASRETRTRMARLACEGVAAVLRGDAPPNAVT